MGGRRGPAASFASSAPLQKVTDRTAPRTRSPAPRATGSRDETAQAQEFTRQGGRGQGAVRGGGAGPDKTALGLKPGSGLQTQSAVAAGPQTPGTKRHRF